MNFKNTFIKNVSHSLQKLRQYNKKQKSSKKHQRKINAAINTK